MTPSADDLAARQAGYQLGVAGEAKRRAATFAQMLKGARHMKTTAEGLVANLATVVGELERELENKPEWEP